ncbi:anaphase-promoting complex subunit 6-like [Diospyros lotus]|uniref:anaphase-promoting complex subunit 6-like n=1 Tax=Diospyros lotus TaxID=55363 RepID=UPI00225C2348|nr:anaphase-promoting complex subunit 6-like [Diospyros lotus]
MQGSKIVAQYEAEFTALARYTPDLISTEEKKASKFQRGLHLEIQHAYGNVRVTYYPTVVEVTYAIESDRGEWRAAHPNNPNKQITKTVDIIMNIEARSNLIWYKKAVWWFEKTLALVPSSLSEMWESTVVNLVHALRKLKRYREAITCYEKALAISTRSLSTYAGLAYTITLQDNFTAAITYYHKALWLKPYDQFCTEMLTLALADECRFGVRTEIDSHSDEIFI